MNFLNVVWTYARLTRPVNLLMIGLLQWALHAWLIMPLLMPYHIDPATPLLIFWIFFSSIILIAAGGYVINDYFDMRIDAMNKPESVIVGELVTKKAARHFYLVLTILGAVPGFFVALHAHSTMLAIVIFLLIGLLWFYSSTYKRQFVIGNVIVAFVVALVPIAIVALEQSFLSLRYGDLLDFTRIPSKLYAWAGGYALFAFLLTWIREVVKDLEDEPGDRALECRTMPVKWGTKRTKLFLYGLIVVTLLLLYKVVNAIEFPDDFITMPYFLIGIVLPFALIMFRLWKAHNSSNFHQISFILKIIMLIGIGYTLVFYFLQAITGQFPFFGWMITPSN
ncbi:MAG: geranylgeranylglycerol-phosphate geranylgeranyltransferase [Microbacter sp.]